MSSCSDVSILDRLEARSTTDPVTGCKIWNGALIKGYGVLKVGDKMCRGYKLAWEAINGPVPEGLELDHLCHTNALCGLDEDCPHRACWNPDHLEVVTHQENIRRGESPAGINARKTHCNNGHEFVPHLTNVTKAGRRVCYLCKANYRAKRRGANPSGGVS